MLILPLYQRSTPSESDVTHRKWFIPAPNEVYSVTKTGTAMLEPDGISN